MNDFYHDKKEILVTKDVGFDKAKIISPENRQKVRERVNNLNIVTGRYLLKEIFADIDITVIPEKMTMWYQFTE